MLLLASGSPRRREILETLFIPHVVHAVSVDESTREGEPPAAYLERVVLAKAEAASRMAPEEVRMRASFVLVADTSVIVDGRVWGKPAGRDEARAMILGLSGREHLVMTRFALAAPRTGAPVHAETVTTRVFFRRVDPDEAQAYAEQGEGLDKAGGYAVQGTGMKFVQRIDGSYTNVVGLPACELVVALRKLGMR